jgi:hypothetical protein
MGDTLRRVTDVTWKCKSCGTTVRTGQAHYGLKPTPHASLAALIVFEPLEHLGPADASPGDAWSMRYFASEIEGK